jgi:hypothetical protein
LHADPDATPHQHFDTLIQAFTIQRKELRAFGICSDVRPSSSCPPESTGAIQVNLESSDGVAEVCLQPFVVGDSLRLLARHQEASTRLVFRARRNWWWPWGATYYNFGAAPDANRRAAAFRELYFFASPVRAGELQTLGGLVFLLL